MKRILIVSMIALSLESYSQDGKFSFGARNSGIAGASVTLEDSNSLFNNVGGLGRVQEHTVIAGYQNRFGIKEFQVVGAGVVYAFEFGTAGIGFYKFGDDLFSQQRIHIGFGNQFQHVSLGIGLDLMQYHVSGVGTKQALAFQFGGIAEITPQLFLGAHIFNLNQVELVKETHEKVPTVMKAGISYRPTNEVHINIEIEKDLDFDETIKSGIEYQIVNNTFIRTGFSTKPFLSAYGIGVHPKRLKFDYSFSVDSNLGNIHELSLTYVFKK